VNNRLHAARRQLKQRMLTMVQHTFESHALADDFANRIGRLVAARGHVVEALFDPASLPDILTELAVSDEAGRRGIAVQVVQRKGGVVRAVATTLLGELPRGATVSAPASTPRRRRAPSPSTASCHCSPARRRKAPGWSRPASR
jgi:hypothetical protein